MTDTSGFSPAAPTQFATFPPSDFCPPAVPALLHLIRQLIETYVALRAIETDIWDESDHGDVDHWGNVASRAAIEAERQLALAILSMGSELKGFPDEPLHHALTPRGVAHNGFLYLVVQNPDDLTPLGQRAVGAKSPIMRIVHLAIDDIVQLPRLPRPV